MACWNSDARSTSAGCDGRHRSIFHACLPVHATQSRRGRPVGAGLGGGGLLAGAGAVRARGTAGAFRRAGRRGEASWLAEPGPDRTRAQLGPHRLGAAFPADTTRPALFTALRTGFADALLRVEAAGIRAECV